MKKVLIVSYSMGIGGVERALLGLLHAIDYSQTDVTLQLARKQGELLKDIPDEVKVEQIDCIKDNWEIFNKPLVPIITRLLTQPKSIIKGFCLCYAYLLFKIKGHYHKLFQYLLKKDSRKFDLAISYAGPSSLLDYYVAKCVTAKKKISWIHYDLSKFTVNKQSLNRLYPCFDKIFVVSEEGKKIFDTVFTAEKTKSEVFHNLINPKQIKSLAASNAKDVMPRVGVNCVSVGRLSEEKGQDLAIEAIAELIKRGVNINLTLVGDGNFRSKLEKLAEALKISDHIYFAGSTPNPYPYMAQCDIYIQTSRHEGYCITLAESRLFGMPIVATDFTGAREQLHNYKNGLVAQHTPLSIADNLEKIVSEELYSKKYPISDDYNNDFHKLSDLLKA